ncbi:hypothetical protein D3C80_1065400 [compost metagenome]
MSSTERQCLFQYMQAQGVEQIGPLDRRKELGRRKHPKDGMVPANQGFNADHLAIETDLGLIMRDPLVLAAGQFGLRQCLQLGELCHRGDLGWFAAMLHITQQHLMQHDVAGHFLVAPQYVQAQLPRQVTDAVDHALFGAAMNDQSSGQLVVRQVPDHGQAIGALELQVTDGDVDRATTRQGLGGILHRLGRQHIENTDGIEHLMQGHQLKWMVLQNQDFQRSHVPFPAVADMCDSTGYSSQRAFGDPSDKS